ncbi:MAG TPA: NAD-dependent epimerase/dehydratase family protein [Steroidobacteraceae bacterium]|nr:NAD-dependent epimerase/dehydratase family protein [Steroidobacteraceae bacterium]
MQTEAGRVALVAGASGMVGRELLRVLAAEGAYQRIVALSRRPLSFEAPRLANRIIRFENIENDLRGLVCDDAFCCLGTTLREAGSPQAFRAVDYDLVLQFARFAQSAGAKTLIAVSSAGAAPEARNFYLQVKGETELALVALRFRALHLMQPSLLLGARKEWRATEAIGRVLMPVLNPLLLGRNERWRAIPARTVAAAMAATARLGTPGMYRHTWPALQALARTGRLPMRV